VSCACSVASAALGKQPFQSWWGSWPNGITAAPRVPTCGLQPSARGRYARATAWRKQRAVGAREEEGHKQALCSSVFATRRMALGRHSGGIKFHLAIKTFKV